MRSRYRGARRVAGFTLVELMITIVVLAIIIAIAAPNFTSLINSNRLTGAGNELIAVLQTARTEALRRNRTVTVCSSANGTSCGQGPTWIALIKGTGGEVLRQASFSSSVKTAGTGTEFVFRSDGFARSAPTEDKFLDTTIKLCIDTKAPVENARLISLKSGSRISMAKSSGACK